MENVKTPEDIQKVLGTIRFLEKLLEIKPEEILIFFRELEKIRNKKGLKNIRPAFVNNMMVQGFSRLEKNLRMNQEIENGLK